MAELHRCERCGGASPADARFCIDCGATLAAAATGPTTRLPGVRCPSCSTGNPEHARFCVVCGRGLVASVPASVPEPAPRPLPAAPSSAGKRPHSARQHSYPRVAVPQTPFPVAPRPAYLPRRQPSSMRGGGPLLFVAGVFVLLLTHTIWPGILVLIGISTCLGAAARGRGNQALLSLIWWGGLALLFASGTFWPGILVLIFLSMAFGGRGRGFGW